MPPGTNEIRVLAHGCHRNASAWTLLAARRQCAAGMSFETAGEFSACFCHAHASFDTPPTASFETIPELPEMSEPKMISYKDGATGWLVFSTPERLNAVSFEMWLAIPECIADFVGDPEIRVVVLRGEGDKAF